MTRARFWKLYSSLADEARGDLSSEQAAALESKFPGIFVSRDSRGAAALVIETVDTDFSQFHSYDLRGLKAQFGVTIDLLVNNEFRTTTASVVRCTLEDKANIKFFLEVCESIVGSLGDRRDSNTVAKAIDRAVWIFGKLTAPAKRDLVGLTGELLFIAAHPRPAIAVSAWRAWPTARFDFIFDAYRVDVKATSTRSRIHAVSYEQANPPAGARAVLASVFVEETSSGMTGDELLGRVLLGCADDVGAQLRVQEVITDSLGETLVDFLRFTFDAELAGSSMQFYDATAIPAIRDSPPIGVGRIRFSSDFGIASTIELP